MKSKSFPRLQYPLHTKLLTAEQRLILLAYDIIWRNEYARPDTEDDAFNFAHDVAANLMQLGAYIEHHLPNQAPFQLADETPIFDESI